MPAIAVRYRGRKPSQLLEQNTIPSCDKEIFENKLSKLTEKILTDTKKYIHIGQETLRYKL
jgi:hypothetical protein